MQDTQLQSARSSIGPIVSPSPDQPSSGASESFYASRHAPPRRAQESAAPPGARLAVALGWIGIGIGLAELLAPRRVARAAGLEARPELMRALGARELASGVGLLSGRGRGGWLGMRVAGDILDLTLFAAAAFAALDAGRRRRATASAAAASGIAALGVAAGLRQAAASSRAQEQTQINVSKSVAVNRTPQECYEFWRNFGNFPRFMKHVKDVRILSDTRSHWVVKAPAGASVEWDAEITYDQPGQLLVWHSVADADIDNAGQVRFEPDPRGDGTLLHIELQYRPPGGQAGALIARLFGEESSRQIEEDIRRFKQLAETGEISTTIGQPSGRRSLAARLARKGAPG